MLLEGAKVAEVIGSTLEKTAETLEKGVEYTEKAQDLEMTAMNETPIIEGPIKDHIEFGEGEGKVLKPRLEMLKVSSLESLVQSNVEKAAEMEEVKKPGLTEEEKALIKEETGWSDEIIDAIESMDQYEIYKNADLHEAEVNGRKCLLKDIDLDYVDPDTGLTNRELMEKGRSPIDSKTGEKIELHHMGQDFDGPFAELTENSEHGDGNHKTLHGKMEDSWRNNPEQKNQYQTEKRNHWKTRAQGEV